MIKAEVSLKRSAINLIPKNFQLLFQFLAYNLDIPFLDVTLDVIF